MSEEERLIEVAKEQLEATDKVMAPLESPLDRAERLNTETKQMMEKIAKDKSDYENARANDQMKGRSVLTQPPKTQEDLDHDLALSMKKMILG
jgi:hypothetical protein